jgi:Protein of unknown function (DUF2937)
MRRTLAMLGGLGLGLCFSQFPEYAQQYEQRLGGAVDELKSIVTDFDKDATRFGLSRDQALQRYAVSPDDFLVARGTSMDATLARYTKLSAMLTDLQHAGPLERVTHLGDYLDSDVGARALQTYKPAVPVTFEGLAWGLAGWVIGYLLTYPLLGFFTLPFRWRRGHTPHHRAPLWRRSRELEIVEVIAPPRQRLEPVAETPVITTQVRVEPPPRPETQREADQRIVRSI